ncbi:MAG: hypothetical protein ISQ14_12280 [Verrucomicrobiae bacterium]|jgi:type II secretory pathway component PulK|nr:hypothetical protein [Verrucomicrobiae bacterium]
MKFRSHKQGNRGFATLVVMMVVGLMLIYVAANTTSIGYVDRSLRLIEAKQLEKFPRPAEAGGIRP